MVKKGFADLTIAILGLTMLVLVVMFLVGFGGLLRVVTVVSRLEPSKRELVYENFLPNYNTVNGPDSLSGVYAGVVNGKIYLWTLGGVRSFGFDETSSWVVNDSCDKNLNKIKVLYGISVPLQVKKSEKEWQGLLKPGMVVYVRYSAGDKKMMSIYYQNPDLLGGYAKDSPICR